MKRLGWRVLRLAGAMAVAAPMVMSAEPAAVTTQPAATQFAATLPAVTQPGATQPAAATQALTEAAATQSATTRADDLPATQSAAAGDERVPAEIRLNFRDTPLDTILERISRDAGLSVVREASSDARMTVISLQPLTAAQAVTLLNAALAENGLAAVQSGRTLRIVKREKARHGNVPVHFGADPAAVESTDDLITQVIPVRNVDAVKLKQDLAPLVGTDADMTANAGSNAIVMTDTSVNVRRIVQIVSVLDKREGATSQLKIIPLKNATAASAARLVLAIFRPEEPRAPKDQPQPPQPKLEGALLGTGVDQALRGGKVTAAADDRTNSVVVAAPSETLKLIEGMLKEIDENPATSAMPVIKSYHLKVADAQAVAHALRAIFQQTDEGQPAQSHQLAADEALHSRLSVQFEQRTNTLIVTASPAAMNIVAELVKEVDQEPPSDSSVRSFALKFADAQTTAKVIQNVFVDPASNQARGGATREKVSATADARTNTVFVTGPAEAMTVIEQTVHDLDASPTSGADVRFFRLKQADAESTAKLIVSFFKPPEGGGNEKRPADAVHVGVNAVPDPRTNTVAVTAPAEVMTVIEQIIKEVETAPSTAFDIESFTLKNADADATAKLLVTVFQPDPGGGGGAKAVSTNQPVKEKVVAASDARTNTVVVTASAETLKVIEGVVKLLDATPIDDARIQVFQLKNADAYNAASLLESIFAPKSLQTGGGSPSTPRPPGQLDAVRKLGWIDTNADERTNTLIVTAPPGVLQAVQGIIHQLDSSPAAQEAFFLYRLRNAQAANLQVVLNQLFGNTQLGGANPGQLLGPNGQRLGAQQAIDASGQQTGGLFPSNRSGNGLVPPGATLGAGGTGIGSRRGTVSGPVAAQPAPQLSAGATRVLSELSGQVFVVADPDTNSLLVTTASRYETQVRSIIGELDRPVPQVLIKVLVAEVTHDNSADWGTDFSVLNRRPNGNGTAVAQNLGAAAAAANGGLVVSLVEDNVNLTLHALATEGKLDVLSRPYILASDNQLASITVGQEVPFITNTQITDTGQQINTIQYQDIGIILNVTPHINPEGLVILDVAPEISQLSDTTVPIGPGVAAPVIAKRSAQSRVGIKNGNTIVIGGLMQDSKTDTITKVPILGDIPILGEAFRRVKTSRSKTELLIFLTPHVAQQPDALTPMTADELTGTKLAPGAVYPGALREHLRGMTLGAGAATQPASQPSDPVIEFNSSPATQPAVPVSSGAIPLP